MTIFYLIRHGEKKKDIGNPGLSDVGKHQAQKTAQYLLQFPITALYASPFARTRETAQHIADLLSLDITIDPNLKERMNWGDVPGQTFEEFIKEWVKASQDPKFKPQVGDSSEGAAKRLEKTVKNLSIKHKDEHIVLVTHGGIIRDFLMVQVPQDIRDSLQETHTGIRECSITKVIVDGKKLQIESFDIVSHLQ